MKRLAWFSVRIITAGMIAYFAALVVYVVALPVAHRVSQRRWNSNPDMPLVVATCVPAVLAILWTGRRIARIGP
jgi:hypothetical protein